MLPFISVHLQVVTWTRIVAVGGDAHDILRFSSKLIDRDIFRTPKPGLRDLTAMPWDIELTCDGWASPLGGIGVASHHPEWQSDDHFSPERFWINAATTPGQFRQVLELLQEWHGHQLVASFDLDGLVYGWEPDGSSVEWDLSTPNLPIRKASFILKPVTDEEEIDETPAVYPLRQPVVPEKTSQESPQLASIIGLLRFLAAVAVGACLVSVFK